MKVSKERLINGAIGRTVRTANARQSQNPGFTQTNTATLTTEQAKRFYQEMRDSYEIERSFLRIGCV